MYYFLRKLSTRHPLRSQKFSFGTLHRYEKSAQILKVYLTIEGGIPQLIWYLPIYRTKQLLHLVLPPSSSSGKIAFRKLFLNYVHFTRYLQHISMNKSRNVPLLCSGITSFSENKIPIKKFLFLNTLVTEICLFPSSQAATIWRPGTGVNHLET